ncbi:MAG: substrate binding domain-containing protein, partial [Herbaspirillum sp.]
LELTDRFVSLSNEGFDIAIRHTDTLPETHVAWSLCETHSRLFASPTYLAQHGIPSHPSELTTHNCLLYLRDNQAGHWTFVRNEKQKPFVENVDRVDVRVVGTLKVNNSEVLREALLADLGIGLLPNFSTLSNYGKSMATPLVAVLPDWQVKGFFGGHIYALRPWSAHVPRTVQLFLEHLRQSFTQRFPLA